MGLDQFERRLERLVEGAFAKAFRGGLQPVEIGRRLNREMDLRRTVGVRGVIAPNAYRVLVSKEDFTRFQPLERELVSSLAEAAREHARAEGYLLVGPLEVDLEPDDSLSPGTFLVGGEVKEGKGGPAASVVLPDGSRVRLAEEPLAIGRLPDCDVVLVDPNVSRRHAELRRDGTTVVVVDLGSTNGTRVNGATVKRRQLSDGDEISVGSSSLRFEAS
jgi:pSer/pThr/pTyr-binding forkhead associated (FHA) protein